MSASRALYSRGVCRLGTSLTRRRGSTALFNSLAEAQNAAAGGGARPAADSVESSLKSNRRDDRPPPQRKSIRAESATGLADNASNGSRRGDRPPRRKPRRDDDDPVAIFNDVVNNTTTPRKKGEAREPSALGELEITAELNRVSKHHTAKRRFFIFEEEIWPHLLKLKAENGKLPPHLYTLTLSFLGRLVDDMMTEKCLGSGHCLALCKIYDTMGNLDLRIRSGLIMSLCLTIANEQNTRQRDMYVGHLTDMWKYVSQMKRYNQRGRDLQFALPPEEQVLGMIQGSPATVSLHSQEPRWDPETTALSAMFNQFPTDHARYAIPGLLATLAAFSDYPIKPKTLIQAAPLLELARIALAQCNVQGAFIDSVFNEEDTRFHRQRLPELAEMVKGRWPLIKNLLKNEDAVWRRGLLAKPDRKSARTKSLAHFHKLLRSAHAMDNTGVIISLWRDLRASMRKSGDLVAEMRSEPEFMDFWHFVWCASKLTDRLEETQKVMGQIGLQPTIKTYTAMMHGWKLARDADKITAMWDSLVSSEIQLDTPAWTERISGLIELGNLQKGIDTLAEMLTLWEDASTRQKSRTAVQPTIEVVNAAFKPLIRIDRKAAYDVLEWAGREGIHPDVLTYNILLSECFRNKQPDEDVQNLLKAMQDQGIQPDAATFTIILEEALGNMGHATAQEQVAAVNQIIADIKAASLQPNRETYGKMLFAVASLANGSDEAVEAVLRHMRSSGHNQISPHMVLILINRAINRGQRNPDAIHALLERHGFSSIHTGDQRLWEQVVSAYANLGDAKRAIGLYDSLRSAGRPLMRPSTLRDLLLMLIEQEDMETGRRVVKDALADLEDHSFSERRWMHHFWHQAYKYGLLDWNSIPENLRRIVDDGRYIREIEEQRS